ncbi:MAG TPA: hypothetical protein VGF23_14155 [Gaiellaceae bacterium]
MADPSADRELLNEVLEGSQAMAALAADDEVFRAAVDAFRAQDGESMTRLLERHKLAERCEVVCHWLRSKEAVLLCLELAGPPPLEQEPPDVREFAEVVAKVTADEELVELVAQAVQERDRDAWSELIGKQGLERFSHLLCHWACTVHYRLVCDVVCQPIEVERPHLIPELQAAGQSIGRLAADEALFAKAAEAVLAGSCETLSTVLEQGEFSPFCFFICEWFCSWRCLLVCLRLCRIFPLERPKSEIDEMREFALALGKLAENKSVLERLAAANLREDVETVQSLVKELEFERFCIQFCHWVCFLRCQLFCICVCPPRTIAVFTKIGNLYYGTDVHSLPPGSGLTVGDNRAFFSTLRLNGGLSVVDGAPLVEYRFETVAMSADGSTLADGTPILPSSWVPVTPAQIGETNIGSFIRPIAVFPFLEVIQVWVKRTGPGIFTINPSADGWIQVPPMFPVPPMVPGSGWRFVPGSDLIHLDTTTLTPFVTSIDETGVDAGESANAPLQTDVHYGVRMRLRDQGDSGDGADAGTCFHIAINNTRYDNISHHPYWPGGLFGATNELAVASIGIAELASAPCSELTDSLTVQFTAAHSNLGGVGVTLEGPGGPYAFDLNPNAPEDAGENWYGTATPSGWTFDALPPCAYLLKLSVEVLLTTGDGIPDDLVDYIAFCKG